MSKQGILLFLLDGNRLAVGVESVKRITSTSTADRSEWIQESVLGLASNSSRGLVAALGGEERTLAVDEVEGIETISPEAIHALPELAQDAMGTDGIGGLVHREDQLILLVDLPRLIFKNSKECKSDAEGQ